MSSSTQPTYSQSYLDEDGGPAMLGMAISFMILCSTVVLLRCYVRGILLKAFGFDDTLIVVALACLIIQLTFVIVGVQYGLGRHVAALSVQDSVNAFEFVTLWELLYIASTTFIKSSIGASLLRLANTKKWRYVLYFGMTIDFCAGIATFLYVLFTCSPVNYQWTAFNPATPKGHCLPAHGLAIVGYVFLALTCAIYLMFATIPIFMLWNVQMDQKTKLSVMFILSLGLISMVANMVRLKYLDGVLRGDDTLFTIKQDLLWSIAECGTGMITSCLATYRPLLKLFAMRSSKRKGSGGYRETVVLDDIWTRGVKTTVVANKMATASEEDILGMNITRTVEFQVENDVEKAASSVSETSKGSL